jgi:MFS family permease
MQTPAERARRSVRLGLRENAGQFALLLLINAFVGAMVGMERSILPILAEREFGIASRTAILSFLITFGLIKALTNIVAGGAMDRWGRRRMLLAGWLAGLPVPLLIMVAPNWGWIVAANVLLGVNQGLCWSAAIVMKVDLVGPRQRGLAIGLNESSGYLAVSAVALATGYLAAQFGMRPLPFLLGLAAAVGGLVASLFARETRGHAALEASGHDRTHEARGASLLWIFRHVSWRERSLRAVSQAGLVNNLNDGLSWGLLPLFFASTGCTLRQTAILAAVYPAVWGLTQLFTGPLSDRGGRKWMMAGGMALQGGALIALCASHGFGAWLWAMTLLGLGTGLVYPTFLAAVSDHSHPAWRASAIGVYRWWRDLGYVVGAVVAGGAADLLGIPAAIALVGVLTFASAIVLAATYTERSAVVRGGVAHGG